MNNMIRVLLVLLFAATPAWAAQQTVNDGETMGQARAKINSNFDELYGESVVRSDDCSGIEAGFCVDTDDGLLYYYDGDSVELVDTDTDDQAASEVATTVDNFDNNLSDADDTVQKALETLDELVISAAAGTVDTTGTVNADEIAVFSDEDTLKALTESEFKTAYSLELGVDVQAYDAILADLAGIVFAQGDILYFDGTNLVKLSPGTDGYFLKTQGVDADPVWAAPPGGGDITAVGSCANGDCFTDGSTTSTSLTFEMTDNAFETVLTAVDPVVDATVALPNETGRLVVGPAGFGTDNVLTKTDGTGVLTQATGISVDDSNNVTGVVGLTATGAVTGATVTDGTVTLAGNGTITGLAEGGLPNSVIVSADIKNGEVAAEDLAATLDISGKTVTFGLEASDIPDLSGTYEAVDAEILRADTADTISAVFEIQDDTLLNFGNDADFGIRYDETTDDQLEIVSNAATDTTINIENDGAGATNLTIDGDITVAGAMSIGASSGGYIGLNNNSGGRAAGAGEYGLYFETDGSDVLSYAVNGSEKRVMNLGDAQTVSGIKTFSTRQILQGDADVGDASNAGSLRIYDGSDHYLDLQTEALSGNVTWQFPAGVGSAGQALVSDGDNTFTWGNPSAAPAGSDTQVQFNDSSSTGGDAGFVFNKTTNALTLGENGQDGSLILYNESGATDYNLTLQPGTQSGAATVTFPGATGTLATLGNAETFTGAKTFGTSTQLLFRDAALHIASADDGHLDLTADTSIDLNGAVVATSTIAASGAISGNNVNPDTADGATLGTTALEWSDAFFADGATIKLGADQDVTLTHVADTGLTLTGTTTANFTASGAVTGGTVTDGTVTLAGDGTITGVSVGGLPDNIVDNGMMADDAIGTDELANDVSISTSGTIQGRIAFASYSTDQTLTAAANNAGIAFFTGAARATFWDCETANIGDSAIIWIQDDSEQVSGVPASGDHFVLEDGTALTADYEIDFATTARAKHTLICTADDTWSVFTESAASTDGGAQE